MMFSNTLVILDLETTGTWIEKDKIIEIAMIKCFVDGKKEVYDKRVNPQIPIPKIVSELTGIVDDDVRLAPVFKDIGNEVLNFIGSADLAGFNIERFDLPLLERELVEVGLKFNWQKLKIYDAQKVYHLNEKRDLSSAYKFYCNKNLGNAHSALADTEATLEILSAQAFKYGKGEDDIKILGSFNYKNNVEFFDGEKKFRWWNGKLYMMFGKYAKQYSLQEIVKKDPKYLEWIISANFSEEVKALVENALKGQFPKPAGEFYN